jgi:hypothetical protein
LAQTIIKINWNSIKSNILLEPDFEITVGAVMGVGNNKKPIISQLSGHVYYGGDYEWV